MKDFHISVHEENVIPFFFLLMPFCLGIREMVTPWSAPVISEIVCKIGITS